MSSEERLPESAEIGNLKLFSLSQLENRFPRVSLTLEPVLFFLDYLSLTLSLTERKRSD